MTATASEVQHDVQVPIFVELRDSRGRPVRGLQDPSGGTFDAAGDFDRILEDSYRGADLDLVTLGTVDPCGSTEMRAEVMGALLGDISKVLPTANAGSELRGLLRLQVMAEQCARDPESVLVWIGD